MRPLGVGDYVDVVEFQMEARRGSGEGFGSERDDVGETGRGEPLRMCSRIADSFVNDAEAMRAGALGRAGADPGRIPHRRCGKVLSARWTWYKNGDYRYRSFYGIKMLVYILQKRMSDEARQMYNVLVDMR